MHNIKRLSIECQEEKSDKTFNLLNELRNHLACDHQIQGIELCQIFEFVKYEDFNEWLLEEEKKTNYKYIISATTAGRNCKYITFSCNRSGIYKATTDDRQRQLKAQGSRTLGCHCTSSIKVKQMDSIILVSYYKGHASNLSHIPIPKIDASSEYFLNRFLNTVVILTVKRFYCAYVMI